MANETNQAVAPSGEMTYVSKLTLATLGCNPGAVKTHVLNKLSIARMYGVLTDVRIQEDKTQGALWTYFAGNFEGINLQDGTVVTSGKMFLPKGVSELVEAEVNRLKAAGEKVNVSFAFEIRAVKASNPSGYTYEAVAIQDPHKVDMLAEVRKKLAAMPTQDQKQLEAATTKAGGPKVLEGQTKRSA